MTVRLPAGATAPTARVIGTEGAEGGGAGGKEDGTEGAEGGGAGGKEDDEEGAEEGGAGGGGTEKPSPARNALRCSSRLVKADLCRIHCTSESRVMPPSNLTCRLQSGP